MYVNQEGFDVIRNKVREARRRLRKRVSANLVIHAPAFGRFDGQLIDLTTEGCKVHAKAQFAPGLPVVIVIEKGFPLPATVVWSHDDETGLRFGSIDHATIVDRLLATLSE